MGLLTLLGAGLARIGRISNEIEEQEREDNEDKFTKNNAKKDE